MINSISLVFGALTDPLEQQLSKQGYKDTKIETHQKLSDSLSMLRIHGYIPDSQMDRIAKRLLKDIHKNLLKDAPDETASQAVIREKRK